MREFQPESGRHWFEVSGGRSGITRPNLKTELRVSPSCAPLPPPPPFPPPPLHPLIPPPPPPFPPPTPLSPLPLPPFSASFPPYSSSSFSSTSLNFYCSSSSSFDYLFLFPFSPSLLSQTLPFFIDNLRNLPIILLHRTSYRSLFSFNLCLGRRAPLYKLPLL